MLKINTITTYLCGVLAHDTCSAEACPNDIWSESRHFSYNWRLTKALAIAWASNLQTSEHGDRTPAIAGMGCDITTLVLSCCEANLYFENWNVGWYDLDFPKISLGASKRRRKCKGASTLNCNCTPTRHSAQTATLSHGVFANVKHTYRSRKRSLQTCYRPNLQQFLSYGISERFRKYKTRTTKQFLNTSALKPINQGIYRSNAGAQQKQMFIFEPKAWV